MSAVPTTGPHRPDDPNRELTLRRVRRGVIVGTALEWYDFFLYASMAALVFGRVFFPAGDSATATLAAFATFTVGFIARPLGGVVLGYVGDRIGRRTVLVLTFAVMGGASTLIGLLPSYATIGIAAPILLVLLRILQGISAGAEAGTAIVLAYEHADPSRRGRQAAWPALGSSLGLLGASLTVAVLTLLPEHALLSWGWRIPFLTSVLLVAVGIWLRRSMPEAPEFRAVQAETDIASSHTARDLLRSHWRGLFAVAIMTAGFLGSSYTFKTFSISYLQEFRGVAASVGSFGIALAGAVGLVVIPVSGRMTDRYGTRPIMLLGAAGLAAFAFPFFWLLDTGNTIVIWIALIVGTGVVIPMLLGTTSSFMAAQFPPHVRNSGVGTGREIAAAAAGGTVPLAALYLVTTSESHSTWGVSLIFIGAAVAIVIACVCDQGTKTNSYRSAPSATEPAKNTSANARR